jgi:hypothetical protein
VGFERNIRQLAIALALVPGAGALSAEPREPLVVTELPDPALVPLSSAEPRGDPLDEATRRFSAAMAQAIDSDRRSLEQACRSRPADSAAVARYSWQASCLYRRH